MKTKIVCPQLGSEIDVDVNDVTDVKKNIEKLCESGKESLNIVILTPDGKEAENPLIEGTVLTAYCEFFKIPTQLVTAPQAIDGMLIYANI
jgi:hypothetical protein